MSKSVKPEYKVVWRNTVENLTIEVNDLMKIGFMPSGSLAVDGTEEGTWFYQPMIRVAFFPFKTEDK